MAEFAKIVDGSIREVRHFDIVPPEEALDWVPVRREVGAVAETIFDPRLVRIIEVAPALVQEPDFAIEALRAMAAKMQAMEAESVALKQRLAQVEAPLKALAEHAALQVAEQRARDERLAQERAEYLLRKQQEDAA